jgi:hypothetical protein
MSWTSISFLSTSTSMDSFSFHAITPPQGPAFILCQFGCSAGGGGRERGRIFFPLLRETNFSEYEHEVLIMSN